MIKKIGFKQKTTQKKSKTKPIDNELLLCGDKFARSMPINVYYVVVVNNNKIYMEEINVVRSLPFKFYNLS